MGANLITILRNFRLEEKTFVKGVDHDIDDGCVTSGKHRLLRFDFISRNIGDADFYMGRPEDHPELFVKSEAHGHFHLEHFNQFDLVDANGREVVPGFKQAFCLMDFNKFNPAAGAAKYTCDDQGISVGWEDIYESQLPCQFMVIDDVPDGDYRLIATTNAQRLLNEDSFQDNSVTVRLRISNNSVTEL